MGACSPVTINGSELWALVQSDRGGVRVRLSADDWERVYAFPGERVRVRLPGQPEQTLFLDNIQEAPPLVWLTLAPRVGAAAPA